MKKRLISLACVLTLLCSISFGYAVSVNVEEPEALGNEINSDHTTIVSFESDVSYYSTELDELVSTFSDNITQMIYCVDTGADTFTIGYVAGSDGFDSQDMEDKVWNAVESLNDMILTDSKLE